MKRWIFWIEKARRSAYYGWSRSRRRRPTKELKSVTVVGGRPVEK